MIERCCPVRNHGFAPNVSSTGCRQASTYLQKFVASGGFPCGCEPGTLCVHMPDAADRLYGFPDWWDRWLTTGTWLGNVTFTGSIIERAVNEPRPRPASAP